MINTIEGFKVLIGKEVIALPTGDNARIDKSPDVFIVHSCGRKYVKMHRKGYPNSVKSYHPKSGATQEAINTGYGSNAGYRFFESHYSLNEYMSDRDARDKLSKFFRDFGEINGLSTDQVRAIAEIVGVVK